jgi:hypothetical protein
MVAFHVLGVDGPRLGGAVEWETDRARFIGRGRSFFNPIVLDGRALSGTTGAVLDPIGHSRADPTGSGRRHPCRVCHGRCAGSCRRVDAGSKVS